MKYIQTIDQMTQLFGKLSDCDNWSLQLLKITSSKKTGISYYARQIKLHPDGKLGEVVGDICDYYTKKESLNKKYKEIDEYDGVNIGNIIYCLPADSVLVTDAYNSLVDTINNPDTEGKIDTKQYNGYVISGILEGESIRLLSLQNPMTSYENKHRFFYDESSFKEITGTVLQLKSYIDVLIYKGHLYMMSLYAEKLFDMERSYKKKCEESVSLIVGKGIVSDNEAFTKIALAGHNPRKFLSFNQKNLEMLAKNKNTRKSIGSKFGISLTKEGDYDTSVEKNSDSLIKILCNKAMLEPFAQEPMEVESARTWK